MGQSVITDRVKAIAKNAILRGENTAGGGIIPLQDKKPSETTTTRLRGIAETNTKLRRHYKSVLDEYSENRRRAGELRKEIATGARNGADLLELFEKSVKCIECMTGDTAFYTSVMKNVKTK